MDPLGKHKIDYAGNEQWFNRKGQLHRTERDERGFVKPAVIKVNGLKLWYKDGELHRDNDLPAIERPDGSRLWYNNGKLFRINNGPTKIDKDGNQMYLKESTETGEHVKHRDGDLPALIRDNGDQEWWKDGKIYKMVTKRFEDGFRHETEFIKDENQYDFIRRNNEENETDDESKYDYTDMYEQDERYKINGIWWIVTKYEKFELGRTIKSASKKIKFK